MRRLAIVALSLFVTALASMLFVCIAAMTPSSHHSSWLSRRT